MEEEVILTIKIRCKKSVSDDVKVEVQEFMDEILPDLEAALDGEIEEQAV